MLESFELEWHGNTVVVIPASNVESLQWDLVEQAADVIMEPLVAQDVPMVVVDLTRVGYFGSVFLALLLRCHKFVKKRGGELVLCGANKADRVMVAGQWRVIDGAIPGLDVKKLIADHSAAARVFA